MFPFGEYERHYFTERFFFFWGRQNWRNVPLEEWATVGLGHNEDCDITENDIRSEHGLQLRGTY